VPVVLVVRVRTLRSLVIFTRMSAMLELASHGIHDVHGVSGGVVPMTDDLN
jgi:hypothetical protein